MRWFVYCIVSILRICWFETCEYRLYKSHRCTHMGAGYRHRPPRAKQSHHHRELSARGHDGCVGYLRWCYWQAFVFSTVLALNPLTALHPLPSLPGGQSGAAFRADIFSVGANYGRGATNFQRNYLQRSSKAHGPCCVRRFCIRTFYEYVH